MGGAEESVWTSDGAEDGWSEEGGMKGFARAGGGPALEIRGNIWDIDLSEGLA